LSSRNRSSSKRAVSSVVKTTGAAVSRRAPGSGPGTRGRVAITTSWDRSGRSEMIGCRSVRDERQVGNPISWI
jgi:hypothetical protein